LLQHAPEHRRLARGQSLPRAFYENTSCSRSTTGPICSSWSRPKPMAP
jgi:hypothetical protein